MTEAVTGEKVKLSAVSKDSLAAPSGESNANFDKSDGDLQQALEAAKWLEQELQQLRQAKSANEEPKVHRPISFGGMRTRKGDEAKDSENKSSAMNKSLGRGSIHRSSLSRQQQPQQRRPSLSKTMPAAGNNSSTTTAARGGKEKNGLKGAGSNVKLKKSTTTELTTTAAAGGQKSVLKHQFSTGPVDSESSTPLIHAIDRTASYDPALYVEDDFEVTDTPVANKTMSFGNVSNVDSNADYLEYLEDFDVVPVILNTTLRSAAPPLNSAAAAESSSNESVDQQLNTVSNGQLDALELPSSFRSLFKDFDSTIAASAIQPQSNEDVCNEYIDDFETPVPASQQTTKSPTMGKEQINETEQNNDGTCAGDDDVCEEIILAVDEYHEDFETPRGHRDSGGVDSTEAVMKDRIGRTTGDNAAMQVQISAQNTTNIPEQEKLQSNNSIQRGTGHSITMKQRPISATACDISANGKSKDNRRPMSAASSSIRQQAVRSDHNTSANTRKGRGDKVAHYNSKIHKQQRKLDDRDSNQQMKLKQRPTSAAADGRGSYDKSSGITKRPMSAHTSPPSQNVQYASSTDRSTSAESRNSRRDLKTSDRPIDSRFSLATPSTGQSSRELSPNPFRRRFLCINGENFKEPQRPVSAHSRKDNVDADGHKSPIPHQHRPHSAPQRMNGNTITTVKEERKKKRDPDWKKSPSERLDIINKKLAKIREKRASLSRMNEGRILGKRVDYTKSPKKPPFHHPQLEYVYGEIMNSPYLTKPTDYHYGNEIFEMDKKLKDLRRRGSKYEELSDDERPYDVRKVKNSFIRQVAYYVKPPISPLKKDNKVIPES